MQREIDKEWKPLSRQEEERLDLFPLKQFLPSAGDFEPRKRDEYDTALGHLDSMLIRAEDSISISYIGFTSAINREMTLPLMLRKLSPEAEPIILSPTDEYMLDEVSSKAYGKRLVGIPNKVAEIGKDYGGYNGAAELLLLNCDRIVEKAKENNGKCVVVIDGFEVFAKDAIKTGHQRFGHDWDQEVVEGLDPIHSKGRLNRDGINKLSGVELTVVTLVNFDKIENPYAKQYLCGIIGASGFKCTSMNI